MTTMPILPQGQVKPTPTTVELQTKNNNLYSALQHFPYFFTASQVSTQQQQQAIYRLRHQVYCEELNFEPVRESGLEQDEFDYRAIHCFINHTASNALAGTVRLITANNADDKLPIEYYCNSSSAKLAPKCFDYKHICEISRLAVPASIRRRISAANQDDTPLSQLLQKLETECYSSVAVALYLMATLISIENEKYHAYVMIEPALARILRRIGIYFQQIGDSINFNGKRAPYYLDMRTVTSTLKPDYIVLRTLLAEQLGLNLTSQHSSSPLLKSNRLEKMPITTSRCVANAAYN